MHNLLLVTARAARGLVALSLISALLAGCAASGRVASIAPARLLDPTAPLPTAVPTLAGTPGPTASPAATQAAPTASAPTAAPSATPEPAGRTLRIVGLIESIEGEIWVVAGLRVRVPPAVVIAPGLGVGSLVRIVGLVGGDDDQTIVAVSLGPVREAPLVGQIVAIDSASITIDGRVIRIPAGVVVPAGLAPGVVVRVVVDDDDGALVLRLIEPLAEARVLAGTVELIDGQIVIISGQRLRLAPEVLLWQVRLIVGQPVRIIVLPAGGVLTIVTITTITIVVPPPVVVVPIPPTVVTQPPPPRPPAPRPPANNDDDDDDDDDDD